MLQHFWDSLLDWWPYGDKLLVVTLFVCVHSLTSIPAYLFSASIWLFPKSALARAIAPYKFQSDAKPSQRLHTESIIRGALSKVVLGPVTALTLIWPIMDYFKIPIHEPIPALPSFLFQLWFCWFWNDTFFYWAHRMLHEVPFLYKNIHSTHHRFTTPNTLASEFAHPVEVLISNIFPTLFGALVLRSHLVVFLTWFLIRMWETLDAHCGYAFPWSPFLILDKYLTLGPRAHDWHHSHNRGMYGVGRFWDWICGSDKDYLEFLAGKDSHAKTQ